MKLTNKITAIILLLFICVTAFSSCATKKSRSGGQTTESSSEIEDPKDLSVSPEIEEAFNKALDAIVTLDDETMEKVKSAYQTKFEQPVNFNNYNAELGERLGGSFCYGNFNNCIVIFRPTILPAVTTITIAGEEFLHGNRFSLDGYHDGVIYSLDEAYEKGFITKEEIAIAAERHRTIGRYNSLLSLHWLATSALSLTDEETSKNIAEAFSVKEISAEWLDLDDGEQFALPHLRCYGDFNGCVVLLLTSTDADDNTKIIADKSFESMTGITLWAYYEGTLYTLEEAYENGYITQDNIGVAAARHREVERYIEAVRYMEQLK